MNLPDDWSWRAFDQHFGDDQPNDDGTLDPNDGRCLDCGAAEDENCADTCRCFACTEES